MTIVIHNNKEDYTPVEAALLKQEFDKLEVKAQTGNLTIEETRIRVAYIRYQREDNFKIVLEKKPTKAKEPGEKKPRASAKKNTPKKPTKNDDIMRAQQLWVAKNLGKQLTQEELDFVDKMLPPPPDL